MKTKVKSIDLNDESLFKEISINETDLNQNIIQIKYGCKDKTCKTGIAFEEDGKNRIIMRFLFIGKFGSTEQHMKLTKKEIKNTIKELNSYLKSFENKKRKK